MAIPKFENFLYPFLNHLLKGDSSKADMREALIEHFNLSKEDCMLMTKGGTEYQINDRIGWSLQWLRRALFVEIPERGIYRITSRGKDYLKDHNDLRESDLMKYPEFAEYSGRRNNTNSNFTMSIRENDNWLEMVETLKPLADQRAQYCIFYNAVVNSLRFLGWKKSKGTIVTFPSTDPSIIEGIIILNKESDNNQIPVVPIDLCKSYSDEQKTALLFKTMEEFSCNMGLLFSDKIDLYYMEDSSDLTPVCICSVSYEDNDVNGSIICNLLTYSAYDYKYFEQFCKTEYEKIPINSNLSKRLQKLASDSALLTEIVKNYFISEGFDEVAIDEELSGISLKLKIKDSVGGPETIENTNKTKSSHDTTKFSFDGGARFYKKRYFVLEIIRQFVKDHPNSTIDDLEAVFPSEIKSKKRGIVRPLSLVQEWVKENPDVETRFFMQPENVITLSDGMKVVVHNQWGDSFPKFLTIAKKLYNVISDRPYQGVDTCAADVDEPEEKFGIKISADSFSKFKSKK